MKEEQKIHIKNIILMMTSSYYFLLQNNLVQAWFQPYFYIYFFYFKRANILIPDFQDFPCFLINWFSVLVQKYTVENQ